MAKLEIDSVSQSQDYVVGSARAVMADVTALLPPGAAPIGGGFRQYNVTADKEMLCYPSVNTPDSSGWRVSALIFANADSTAPAVGDTVRFTVFASYVSA